MRVWIAQCLCPMRHCIVAVSGEAKNETAATLLAATLRTQVSHMLETRAINPWCGICKAGAETWRHELGVTRFATMAEAEPEMRRVERQQYTTRILHGEP